MPWQYKEFLFLLSMQVSIACYDLKSVGWQIQEKGIKKTLAPAGELHALLLEIFLGLKVLICKL